MAVGKSELEILQVASSLYDWGGIERYVTFLADGMTKRGHRVVVACPPGSPLAQRNARTESIEMRRKLDLRGFAAYLHLFRARRFDVIHGHFSPDFTLPAYAAKLTRQPLTIMTRHLATEWRRPKALAYARLWDHIIPVSDAVRRRLEESGIPAAQMTVAKAGSPEPMVSRPRRVVRAEMGISSDRLAVGSFGRLAEEKGIDILVAAMAETPNAEAHIFGEGPNRAALESQANGRAVHFWGRVEDPAEAMSAMDVIVIPSIWEEAFPYAALEAMALGRPILASNLGGLPEMVTPNENGRLFEAGNAGALAQELRKLSPESPELLQWGESGRQRYEREFTLDHMAARIEAVYLRQIRR